MLATLASPLRRLPPSLVGGCGGSKPAAPLVVGAVDDAAKWAPDPGRAMAERASCRVRRDRAERGLVARRDAPHATCRRCAAQCARPSRHTSSRCSPSTSSSCVDARDRRRPRSLRGVRGGARPRPAVGAPGDRRQRAEPEPVLAAAVRHRRERRRRRLRTRRCSPRPTTRSRALPSPPEVIGGGLAPRGGDDATASRQTHSPTAFIRDLGAAYRASGRRGR